MAVSFPQLGWRPGSVQDDPMQDGGGATGETGMAQKKHRTGVAPPPASKPAKSADNRPPGTPDDTPDGAPDGTEVEERAGASDAGEIGGPAGPEPTR